MSNQKSELKGFKFEKQEHPDKTLEELKAMVKQMNKEAKENANKK